MTGEVEEKAVELMDRAANAVEAFADKLGNLSQQYGPEVADAALAVARVSAINALLFQILCVGLVVGGPYAIRWLCRAASAKEESDRYGEWAGATMAANCIGWTVYACASLALILSVIANAWPIIGVFEPKLWIAKQILGL